METDEMNFEILRSVSNSLKASGKFIFTTLNGLFPIFHSVEQFTSSEMQEGNELLSQNSFDLMTLRQVSVMTFEDDSGNRKELECNERYYMPSEISWLLKSLGYSKVGIYGAKLGAFSRNDRLTKDDFEMLVVAEGR
jgi:hypothetical protein